MSYGKGSARRRENEKAIRANWDQIDWCGSETEPPSRKTRKPRFNRLAKHMEK